MCTRRDRYPARLAALLLTALTITLLLAPPLRAQEPGRSLRFYGTGRDAVDRVVLPLDAPARPIDVGGDFTIELWLRALPGENPRAGCSPDADAWINGHIVVDRDIYNAGDYGDYGISIAGGRVAFGVHNGSSGATICGTQDVTDGAWHHVAVTRSQSGALALFVDGRLDAEGAGPTGDLSYRDGRDSAYPYDPTLVIGAEKHDAGADYPSFRGWVDELRISRVVRYTEPFTRPDAPFAPDDSTVGLYHFDEGGGDQLTDVSGAEGGPSHGTIRYGGDPRGPEWSSEIPWAQGAAATVAPEQTPAPTAEAPAPTSEGAPTSAAGEPWSERFTQGTSFDAHGATILLSDPQSVTELRGVSADGFEASSGGTFVLNTAPLYTPGARYEARRTDSATQETVALTLTATDAGRLSIRMPPGRYVVTIAVLPDTPTPPAEPAPAPTSPPAPTPLAQPDAAPTPPAEAQPAPAAIAGADSAPPWLIIQGLLVGIILAILLWFFRKRRL